MASIKPTRQISSLHTWVRGDKKNSEKETLKYLRPEARRLLGKITKKLAAKTK